MFALEQLERWNSEKESIGGEEIEEGAIRMNKMKDVATSQSLHE